MAVISRQQWERSNANYTSAPNAAENAVQNSQENRSYSQSTTAKKSFIGDGQNDKSTSLWDGAKAVLGASLLNTWGSAKSAISTIGNAAQDLFQGDIGKADWEKKKNSDVWDAIGLSARKSIDKGSQIIADAKKGASNFGDLLLDVGFSGAQMLTDAAIAAATGGGSLVALASMGFRAFGSAAAEYDDGDNDHLDELLAGAKGAGIEVLTEKLGGPFEKIYGKTLSSAINPIAKSVVQKASRNAITRTGLMLLQNFTEEGIEEVLSDVLNPIADKLLKLDNGEALRQLGTPEGIEQMLYDGFVGGILGAIGGGTQVFDNEAKFKAKYKDLIADGAEAAMKQSASGNSVGAKADAYDAEARAMNAQQQVPIGQQIVNDAINGVPPTPAQNAAQASAQRGDVATAPVSTGVNAEQARRLNSQDTNANAANADLMYRIIGLGDQKQDVKLSGNSFIDMRERERKAEEAAQRRRSDEAKSEYIEEEAEAELNNMLPKTEYDDGSPEYSDFFERVESLQREAETAYDAAVDRFMSEREGEQLPKYLKDREDWVKGYVDIRLASRYTKFSAYDLGPSADEMSMLDYIQNGSDPVEERMAYAKKYFPDDRWEVARGNQITRVTRDSSTRTGDDIFNDTLTKEEAKAAQEDTRRHTTREEDQSGSGTKAADPEAQKTQRRKKRWSGYLNKSTEEKSAMIKAENERLESELEALDKKASDIRRYRNMQSVLEDDYNALKERLDVQQREVNKWQSLYEEASQNYADPAYNRRNILDNLRSAREALKQTTVELDKARARLDNNTQALYTAANGYDARWTEFNEDSKALERREADFNKEKYAVGGAPNVVKDTSGQLRGADGGGLEESNSQRGTPLDEGNDGQRTVGGSQENGRGNVGGNVGWTASDAVSVNSVRQYPGKRRNKTGYFDAVRNEAASGKLNGAFKRSFGKDAKAIRNQAAAERKYSVLKAVNDLSHKLFGAPVILGVGGNGTAYAFYSPESDFIGVRWRGKSSWLVEDSSHEFIHGFIDPDGDLSSATYCNDAIYKAAKKAGISSNVIDMAKQDYATSYVRSKTGKSGIELSREVLKWQNNPSFSLTCAEEAIVHLSAIDGTNDDVSRAIFSSLKYGNDGVGIDGVTEDGKFNERLDALQKAFREQLIEDGKCTQEFFDDMQSLYDQYRHEEIYGVIGLGSNTQSNIDSGEKPSDVMLRLSGYENTPVNESDEYIENEEFRQNAEYYEQRYADKQGFDNAQGWAKSNSYEAPETVKTTPEQALEDAKRDFGSRHSEMSDISKRISAVKLPTFSSNADYNKAITNEVDAYRTVVQGVVDGNKSIGDLSDYYASLKDNPLMADYYSERVAKAIEKARKLHDVVSDDKVFNSTKANIRADAATAFKMMEHDFNQATKSIEMKRQLAENAKANGIKISTKSKAFNAVASWFIRMQINPTNVFKAIDGFKKHSGGIGYQLAKMADKATYIRQTSELEAKAKLAEVSKLDGWKNFAKGTTKATVSGDSWSMLDVLSFVKSVETMGGVDSYRTQNANGFAVDDGEGNITYYCTNKELYNKYLKDGTAERLNLKMLDIESAYKEASRAINNDPVAAAYVNAMRNMLVDRRDELQEVHVKVNGTEKNMYKDGLYFPLSYRGLYTTNSDINVQSDIDNFFDNERFMQERTKRDGGWISVKPVTEVMDRYISQTSDYLAYAEFGDTLDRLNKNSALGNGLSESLSKNFGEQAGKWSERYVNDINHRENSTTLSGMANDLLKSGRENLQQGALAFSVSVPLKQSPSYFDAMGVLRPSSLLQAAPQFFSKSSDTEPALLKYRRLHNGDYTLSEILENKDKLAYKLQEKSKVFNWFANATTEVDYRTVSALYKATLIDVEADHPGLYKSDPAKYAELVDEKFSEVVLNTQPVYTRNARAEYSRTNDEAVRIFSMFRTQQTQNLNRLITTLGEAYAAKGTARSSEANKALRQTLSGQAAGALTFALLSSLSDVLLHKRKKYEDKDDNGNLDEIFDRVTLNTIESMAATAWFGDSVSKWLIDTLSGGETSEFYGVSMGPISTVSDVLDSISWFAENPSLSNGRYVAGYISTAFGVPLNNGYAIANSIIMYIRDAVDPEHKGEYDDILKAIDADMKAKAKQNKKEAEAYEKFKAEFPETEVEKDPYSLIFNDIKAAKAAKPENGNKYDTSGDKGVVDAIISGNLSTKDTDALIKDNTSKTFSSTYDSFRILGLEPQEAIDAYTSMDSDSNLSLKQSEMWDWYKQNPDLEFIVAGIWNNKGYSKSWDEYKASKK